MRKILILLAFICQIFANDGFFFGLGGSKVSAKFEANGYTSKSDLSQSYNLKQNLSKIGFDMILGYKWFFNEYFGWRFYGELDYTSLGDINAPLNSTAQGLNLSVYEVGVNADFMFYPINYLGVFAGGFVSYIGTSDLAHKGYNQYNPRPLDFSLQGANYGVNLGANLAFGEYNQHSLEFFYKINFASLQDEVNMRSSTHYQPGQSGVLFSLPTLKAKLELENSIGLRYVYHFDTHKYRKIIDNKKAAKEARERALREACPKFEAQDLAYIKNGEEFFSENLQNGIVEVEGKRLKCEKIKVLKRQNETREFAVNESGIYDFSVKITKEIITAQKHKNGKITQENFIITDYKLNEIQSVIEYSRLLYKEDSPQIYAIQKELDDDYIAALENYELLKRQKAVARLNGVCFKMSGKVYCDGDLVQIFKDKILIRANETGWQNEVRFKLYYTDDNGEAKGEASSGWGGPWGYARWHDYYSEFEMRVPDVLDTDTKPSKERLPKARYLEIEDVRSFKEW